MASAVACSDDAPPRPPWIRSDGSVDIIRRFADEGPTADELTAAVDLEALGHADVEVRRED